MLLVSPNGTGVVLFSEVSGQNRKCTNTTITFDDSVFYALPPDFDLWSEPLRAANFQSTNFYPGASASKCWPAATWKNISASSAAAARASPSPRCKPRASICPRPRPSRRRCACSRGAWRNSKRCSRSCCAARAIKAGGLPDERSDGQAEVFAQRARVLGGDLAVPAQKHRTKLTRGTETAAQGGAVLQDSPGVVASDFVVRNL